MIRLAVPFLGMTVLVLGTGCHQDQEMLLGEIDRLNAEIFAWQRGAEAQARRIQKLLSREDI